MSKPYRFVVLCALALAGCGIQPPQPDDLATPGKRIEGVSLSPGIAEIAKKEGEVSLVADDRVKCEKYMPLGSHRVKFRCTTVKEDVASSEANNREMRKLQTPPPSEGARSLAGN